MSFRVGERVVFVRDYPVGDTAIPENTKGVILAEGHGIYEVGTKWGPLLIEEEFLDVPTDTDKYGYEFDIHLGNLPKDTQMQSGKMEKPKYEHQEKLPVWMYQEDLYGGYEAGLGYPGPEYKTPDPRPLKRFHYNEESTSN